MTPAFPRAVLLVTLAVLTAAEPVDAGQEGLPVAGGEVAEGEPAGGLAGALDCLARQVMDRGRVPGLAVVLVREGTIAWAEGYGRERIEGGEPVAPGRTRFSVGSVSKVVTAVAVLQLVEQGRLDLEGDLRATLPGSLLPSGPGGPVTLHHLLTHTAGFEPASIGLAARSPAAVEPLESVLATRMPRRVHPPGRLYLYSQFDYGLAGLAVQEASGRPFERFARDRVFTPAGMSSASFRPEAPGHDRVAAAYHWTGEDFERAPTAFHHIAPAGGLVATPLELGRFMATLLPDGDSGSAEIVAAETIRTMTSRQWSPHPHARVEGTAYGLFEYRACGFRALSTRGWVGGHSAYFHIVPDHDVGFLVVGNASSLQGLESALRLELHARLPESLCADGDQETTPPESNRPLEADPGEGIADKEPMSAGRLAGRYRSVGFGSRGVEALGRYLLSPTVEVRSGEDGPELDLGGRRVAASRVDSLLLRAPWGQGREEFFSFLGGDAGAPRFMAWEGSMYEKVPAYRSPRTLRIIAALVALLFLTGPSTAAVRLLRRWRSGPDGAAMDEGARRLRRGSVLLCLLALAFGVGIGLHLVPPARYQFAFGLPETVVPLLWLPAAWTVLAAGLALESVRVWRRRHGSMWERLRWSLVVATGLGSGAGLLLLGILPVG